MGQCIARDAVDNSILDISLLQSLPYARPLAVQGHRATLPSDGIAGRSEAYLNAAMHYRGVVIATQRFGRHDSERGNARVHVQSSRAL